MLEEAPPDLPTQCPPGRRSLRDPRHSVRERKALPGYVIKAAETTEPRPPATESRSVLFAQARVLSTTALMRFSPAAARGAKRPPMLYPVRERCSGLTPARRRRSRRRSGAAHLYRGGTSGPGRNSRRCAGPAYLPGGRCGRPDAPRTADRPARRVPGRGMILGLWA